MDCRSTIRLRTGSQIVDRASIYLVAKVEESDNAYEAFPKYLGEIGVDYADLILIHWPPGRGVGAELWQGLQRACSDGRYSSLGSLPYE